MGKDTCYLEMTLKQNDLVFFNEILKEEQWEGQFWDGAARIVDGEDAISVSIEEADMDKWWYYLKDLASASLTFEGHHSENLEIGACRFACFEGHLAYAPVHNDFYGVVMIPVDRNMNILRQAMDEVRAYYDVLKQAEEYLGYTNNGQ